MYTHIKERWIAALRSGDYPQGREELRSSEGYCCLGVLCDLHAKDTGASWSMDDDYGCYEYNGTSNYITDDVAVWAGLTASDCLLRRPNGEYDVIVRHLPATTMNDDMGLGFREIADEIEQHLPAIDPVDIC